LSKHPIYTIINAIDPNGMRDWRQNHRYDSVPDVPCIGYCDFARGEVDRIKEGRRHVLSSDNLETTNHVEAIDKKDTGKDTGLY
jgi:hypothetical protein